jgi:ArsR family transcriptional regulator
MKRQIDPDVRLLQAAADPNRLAILRQLAIEGTVCACDFSSCCDVSQPTLSHHLRVLREAGWVRATRRGSWMDYDLEPSAVERFRAIAGDFGPVIAPNAMARHLTVLETPIRPS